MALFFFVVGLEIKRELSAASCRPARAALPALAARPAAIVPALIFLLLAGGGGAASGWGIPMATDIAFAIGVLAVLGDRVSAGVKLFLLAIAVVDDIIAIAVIARRLLRAIAARLARRRDGGVALDRRDAAARRHARRRLRARRPRSCGSRRSSPACTRPSRESCSGC